MKEKMRVVGEMPIKRARYKGASRPKCECDVFIDIFVSHVCRPITCSVSCHLSRLKSCELGLMEAANGAFAEDFWTWF
jgi:hypothetical protein